MYRFSHQGLQFILLCFYQSRLAKVCPEKGQRYSQQIRRNLQQLPTLESWCQCGQLRAARKNEINEYQILWLCVFVVYLRHRGANMTGCSHRVSLSHLCRWVPTVANAATSEGRMLFTAGEKIKSDIRSKHRNIIRIIRLIDQSPTLWWWCYAVDLTLCFVGLEPWWSCTISPEEMHNMILWNLFLNKWDYFHPQFLFNSVSLLHSYH